MEGPHARPAPGRTTELSGTDAEARIPGMSAHLAGCPACAEEHESLRAIVRQDAAGGSG
jgi:anti-sigma factor RsiW